MSLYRVGFANGGGDSRVNAVKSPDRTGEEACEAVKSLLGMSSGSIVVEELNILRKPTGTWWTGEQFLEYCEQGAAGGQS